MGLEGWGGILEKHFAAPAVQAGSKPLPVAVRDGDQDVISPGGQRLMTGCNGNSGPLSFVHKQVSLEDRMPKKSSEFTMGFHWISTAVVFQVGAARGR